MHPKRLVELIDGCRRYDRTCQKELYQAFHPFALSVALRYSASTEEGREIVNDAFYKIFTQIDRYDPAYAFRAWLNKIVVHTAIDYFRKYHRGEPPGVELSEAEYREDDGNALEYLEAEDLLALVRQLPPAYRLTLGLYALEGYDHQEIARMLSISVGASKSNLFKARAKLRTLLARQDSKHFGR